MKTKFFVLICAAVSMVACGGGNNQPTTCSHDHHHDHVDAANVKKIIAAQVFIKPEKVNDFIALSQDLVEKSRAEVGNISYTLYQNPLDNTKFLVFEEWKNQAAVDFHFATDRKSVV